MIILRQNNYASPIRKLRFILGRKRVDMANRLQKRTFDHFIKNQEAKARIKLNPGLQDKNLLKLSDQSAEKLGFTTIPTDGKSEAKLLKRQIFLNWDDGVDIHAHEVGHVKNYLKRGSKLSLGTKKEPRDRFNISLNTAAHLGNINPENKESIKEKINELREKNVLDTGKGLGETIKRMREGNAIIREENKATNKAIKFLKNNGVNKSNLEIAKNKLKDSGQTYKENAKIHVLNPIQNLIQIPSRRRK